MFYNRTVIGAFRTSAADFLFFWGVVFLISTTLVAVMKRENDHGRGKGRVQQEETQGVMETYKLLFSIIKMPTVFTFCSLLLTAKVLHRSSMNIRFTSEVQLVCAMN